MNGLDLVLGMNNIDDRIIDSVLNKKVVAITKQSKATRPGWMIAAACLCLLLGLGVWRMSVLSIGRLQLNSESNGSPSTQLSTSQGGNAPFGVESRDKLQFEGENYWRDFDNSAASIQESWVFAGEILSYAESQWDFTGDFQANREAYIGCKLYRDNSRPGELWLAYDAQYLHFIAERYIPYWIYFDGKLYLTESWLELIGVGTPPSVHVTAPPEDAIDLGLLIYSSETLLPDQNLETNEVELDQHRVYFSSDLGCLLVEIPTPDGTQYWYYYPVDPDAFVKKQP